MFCSLGLKASLQPAELSSLRMNFPACWIFECFTEKHFQSISPYLVSNFSYPKKCYREHHKGQNCEYTAKKQA